MDKPDHNPGASLWAASPTARQKNAASRNLSLLLDMLAPQQVVRRAERPKLRVERYRTPDGAVLQAANAALTVSWFPEATEGSALGELHVLLWQGTVVRRGAMPTRERAVMTSELVLRPVETPEGEETWVSSDGTTYDTASLAAHCLALLEQQIEKTSPPDLAPAQPSA